MVCCCVHITAVVTCIENANSTKNYIYSDFCKHESKESKDSTGSAGSLGDSDFGSTRRFSEARREGPAWKREEKEEKESVRFRGHQAEVAMITITACSYLTLVDPNQQAAKKQ